jgi:hypothetical protein
MMRDVTQVVDRVNVKPARQEWILALNQRLRNAAEEEHRRQQQPYKEDGLPRNEDHHRATSCERATCAL